MNDKSQVKSDPDWGRYLKETGNIGSYADSECGCYQCKKIIAEFDDWKLKQREPRPATITIPLHEFTALQSQLTKAQEELAQERVAFNDVWEHISTLQSQLTQLRQDRDHLYDLHRSLLQDKNTIQSQLTAAHKERDELSAKCAEMRHFLKSWLPVFPLNDWLAERDRVTHDQCGTALLARLKEAEWLLSESHKSCGADSYGQYVRYPGRKWVTRRDQWLKEGAR